MSDESLHPYRESDYPQARAYRAAPIPDPPRPARSTGRMSRLLWLLAILLVLLIGPSLVQRFQYANSFGREKARVDVALAGLRELDELNLQGLAAASRMVAQAVGPSVVHMRTARGAARRGLGDEWSHLEARGEGSGVIVDDSGYIVTNSHVVAGADRIDVHLSDGRVFEGDVKGMDPMTDIAVVKISADDLVPARWGESDALEAGDLVWAVGSPFGLDRSVTFGIVSAKGRKNIVNGSRYQDFLQTDAAVNPGNSGGPLVDIKGRVVGINTAIVGQSFQGISFAIPSSIARDIYETLRSNRRVVRGWLGVQLTEITSELADELALESTNGVLIARVLRDSPADKAGVEAGDVITAWDGTEVRDPHHLSWLVAQTEPGAKAKIDLLRDGAAMELEVEVTELPQQYQ